MQLETPTVLENLVRVEEAGLARPRLEERILTRPDDEEELVLVGVEGNDGDAESGFVVLQIKLEDGRSLQRRLSGISSRNERERAHLDGVDDPHARRPVPRCCSRQAEGLDRKVEDLLVDLLAGSDLLVEDHLLRLRRKRAVVGFDNVEELVGGTGDHLARGVGERDGGLLDLGAELGESEDAARKQGRQRRYSRDAGQGCAPKTVAGDTDESLGAEIGGEAPGVVEGVEDEGSELEDILVGVVEP